MSELISGTQLDTDWRAAKALAMSRVIPQHFQGKTEDVFAVLIMGRELGIGPMQAMNSISMIQGRPCMSGQLMLGLVRSRFPAAQIEIKLDEKLLVATCSGARIKGEEVYVATWDMSKAQMMGLAGRDQYKKQPLNMLKWRAVAEMIRVVFPDAALGLYAKEEMQDFDGAPIKELIDVDDNENLDRRTPEQKTLGSPRYFVCYGKFRSKEFKDIKVEDLEDYLIELDKRLEKGTLKENYAEIRQSILLYLKSLEG